jgi:hypothetical protein
VTRQSLLGAGFAALLEHVFHPAEQTAEQGLVVDFGESVEFLQQFSLPPVQFRRYLDAHINIKITLAVAIQDGDAFVANAKHRARLSSLGNLEVMLAIHGGHADFGTHRGLRNRNWDDAMQIVAFARKERVILDVQDDIQVAGRASELANLASPGKTDAGPVFHPGRNLRINRTLAKNATFALALGAWIGDDAARTLARGAGASDAEESLLVTNLAAPITRMACARTFSGSRAGTVAVLASFVAPNGHAGFGAEEGLLEFEVEIFTKIGAALNAAAATAPAAEHVSESEELAEDVAKILEDGRIEAALGRTSIQPGMPVAVVDGPLFRIGKHGIGFTDLFEFLFRVRIVGIAVGMILQRQFAIGALEFRIGDRAGYAQHFVVVAFCVRSQIYLSSREKVRGDRNG